MKAGRLDRLITIRSRTVTETPSGAEEESWSIVAQRRPASYSPVRGSEGFAAPETVAKQQVEFWIRYSANVAALQPEKNDIVYPALDDDELDDDPPTNRLFDILAIHEIGRREGLKIIAERRPDAA